MAKFPLSQYFGLKMLFLAEMPQILIFELKLTFRQQYLEFPFFLLKHSTLAKLQGTPILRHKNALFGKITWNSNLLTLKCSGRQNYLKFQLFETKMLYVIIRVIFALKVTFSTETSQHRYLTIQNVYFTSISHF